ncbi:MAG: IS30 family transposase [Clostridiales bacterium]|nr:IS30 family transposase [Clostridiales bacterium]
MSYRHFTTFERGRIQKLLSLGYSRRSIAQKLNRHHFSFSREIRRNMNSSGYTGESAQLAYDTRRKASKPKEKFSESLAEIIADKLLVTWSSEQIANTVTLGTVSCKTIYNWLYRRMLPALDVQSLWHKGKRRKVEKRGRFSIGTPISERPKEVRNTFGH